jgi:hypothetical protein
MQIVVLHLMPGSSSNISGVWGACLFGVLRGSGVGHCL